MVARDRIIESNLLLVMSQAMRCRHRLPGKSLDVNDLVQAGNEGLFRAVEKFDPDLGYAFSTYAIRWIRERMDRAIRSQGSSVRLPTNRSKAGEPAPQVISSDAGAGFLDSLASDEGDALDLVAESDLRGMLGHVVSKLKARERLVIEHRFGLNGHEPKSLAGTARIVGRCAESVRLIQNVALRKLRELAEELELETHLAN